VVSHDHEGSQLRGRGLCLGDCVSSAPHHYQWTSGDDHCDHKVGGKIGRMSHDWHNAYRDMARDALLTMESVGAAEVLAAWKDVMHKHFDTARSNC